ncbi:MAG: type VI secretion system baseplate subunit TssE [Pseudorhodobacter sp.]
MADQSLSERLQPSLLDRLTDDDPTNPSETRESRVIDLRRLREIIQRDLSWLLNSFDNSTMFDPERYPNVTASVLSYGVQEVAGEYSTLERIRLIRSSIQRAIEKFEPRIMPGSLDVLLRDADRDGQTIVNFDISADMWAQPLPMELYLRGEVDTTTGELQLDRPGMVGDIPSGKRP